MKFKSGMTYTAYHKPTNETWAILGVAPDRNKVCAAGYPATIGNLSDCDEFIERGEITEDELKHRLARFGENWL